MLIYGQLWGEFTWLSQSPIYVALRERVRRDEESLRSGRDPSLRSGRHVACLSSYFEKAIGEFIYSLAKT